MKCCSNAQPYITPTEHTSSAIITCACTIRDILPAGSIRVQLVCIFIGTIRWEEVKFDSRRMIGRWAFGCVLNLINIDYKSKHAANWFRGCFCERTCFERRWGNRKSQTNEWRMQMWCSESEPSGCQMWTSKCRMCWNWPVEEPEGPAICMSVEIGLVGTSAYSGTQWGIWRIEAIVACRTGLVIAVIIQWQISIREGLIRIMNGIYVSWENTVPYYENLFFKPAAKLGCIYVQYCGALTCNEKNI